MSTLSLKAITFCNKSLNGNEPLIVYQKYASNEFNGTNDGCLLVVVAEHFM